MKSLVYRRPAAVIAVSLLQLFVHAFVDCRDVNALADADHLDNGAMSVSNHRLSRQLRQSSAFADDDSGFVSDRLSRQRRSADNEDEGTLALDDGGFGDQSHDDEKRKWEKNTVRVWGKRDAIDGSYLDEDFDGTDDIDGVLDKRTWSKNKVRVWGKRFADADDDGQRGRWRIQNAAGGDDVSAAVEAKRRWSDNRVRVWGKRNRDDDGGDDGIGRQLQSSSVQVSAADRQKFTGEPRLLAMSLADRRGRNSTVGERRRGKQRRSSSRRTGMNDEDSAVSDVMRQRAAIVKRAIDDSAGDGDELAWISDERLIRPLYYGSSPSSLFHRGRWTTGVKRSGASSYGSMGGAGGRFPFYAGEGPKRSWRTNVIRVWGK